MDQSNSNYEGEIEFDDLPEDITEDEYRVIFMIFDNDNF